jgi:hypothetical protein
VLFEVPRKRLDQSLSSRKGVRLRTPAPTFHGPFTIGLVPRHGSNDCAPLKGGARPYASAGSVFRDGIRSRWKQSAPWRKASFADALQ